MQGYTFNSITINGREVGIDRILENSVAALSDFEATTFSFVQKWFSSTEQFIQNTSGSTGTPKPIAITRQQMIASAKLTEQALQLRSGDNALLCLDPAYIAGKMMLVRSFVTNMKIIATTPSLNPFRELPSDVSVDFTALVPMQLYDIIRSPEVDRLDNLKNIIVGGAALNNDARKKLKNFKCKVYASYGMTETVSHIALQDINGAKASEYFTVLPGVKINSDERGCLEIEAGYLGKKIVTNDLVEIKDDSHFKWLGRSDNLINSGGVKIIPEKIEAAIQTITDDLEINNRFLISSLPDVNLGNKVILLMEGNLNKKAIESIKSSLKQVLHPYEIPKELYTNINFVLTASGKINRVATAEKHAISDQSVRENI